MTTLVLAATTTARTETVTSHLNGLDSKHDDCNCAWPAVDGSPSADAKCVLDPKCALAMLVRSADGVVYAQRGRAYHADPAALFQQLNDSVYEQRIRRGTRAPCFRRRCGHASKRQAAGGPAATNWPSRSAGRCWPIGSLAPTMLLLTPQLNANEAYEKIRQGLAMRATQNGCNNRNTGSRHCPFFRR